jgi:hypothetical protein
VTPPQGDFCIVYSTIIWKLGEINIQVSSTVITTTLQDGAQTYRSTPSTLGSCHAVALRNNARHNDAVQPAAELQPSLALQVQYSMKML